MNDKEKSNERNEETIDEAVSILTEDFITPDELRKSLVKIMFRYIQCFLKAEEDNDTPCYCKDILNDLYLLRILSNGLTTNEQDLL